MGAGHGKKSHKDEGQSLAETYATVSATAPQPPSTKTTQFIISHRDVTQQGVYAFYKYIIDVFSVFITSNLFLISAIIVFFECIGIDIDSFDGGRTPSIDHSEHLKKLTKRQHTIFLFCGLSIVMDVLCFTTLAVERKKSSNNPSDLATLTFRTLLSFFSFIMGVILFSTVINIVYFSNKIGYNVPYICFSYFWSIAALGMFLNILLPIITMLTESIAQSVEIFKMVLAIAIVVAVLAVGIWLFIKFRPNQNR
jgi:hypothetical protein